MSAIIDGHSAEVGEQVPAGHDRSKFLGGSDVAAIFGVSPWKTPVDLYLDKITPRSERPDLDPKREAFFKRRKRQEPVIKERLEDEFGLEITRLSLDEDPNRYRDAEYPFMAAEIDFEFSMRPNVRERFPGRDDFAAIPDGTLLNGEIKTVHPFKAGEWGEEGTEEVPVHYAAQFMHGLGVTKRPGGLIAAMFGIDDLICFPIMADQETIATMRAKAAHFWLHNVAKRIPPDPVNADDVKRLYAGCSGRPVSLDKVGFDALLALDALRKQAKQVELDQGECEWRIARAAAASWGVELVATDKNKPEPGSVENALLMFEGRQVGSWNRRRGAFLDQRRLKDDKPEIIEAYTKEHYYRVIQLKKGK